MNGPASSSAQVSVRLNILQPGAASNQFYLPEISGCWKLDGSPCDGNLTTDVTRWVPSPPLVAAGCAGIWRVCGVGVGSRRQTLALWWCGRPPLWVAPSLAPCTGTCASSPTQLCRARAPPKIKTLVHRTT
jgi:hypothetical protein